MDWHTNTRVFRVYLPIECLRQGKALAVGCFNETNGFCCVTGLYGLSNCTFRTSRWPSCDVSIVGLWENDSTENGLNVEGGFAELQSHGLYIRKSGSILSVEWYPGSQASRNSSAEFVLILYESSLFVSSKTILELKGINFTNSQIIIDSLSNQHKFFECLTTRDRRQFYDPSDCRVTFYQYLTSAVVALLDFLLTCLLLRFCVWISQLRFFEIRVVKMALETASTTSQIRIRYGTGTTSSTSHSSNSHWTSNAVRFENKKCLILLDIILGLCALAWLWTSDFTGKYADYFITWAESVAVQFESLLNWLMGAPAGLKLNEPLACFLGNFFLYHIFLWKAYLQTLKPYWSDICFYSCLSGCLGLTVQLSLIQDLISMMTIHIYCFYVYAARLYYMQIYALSSLWRLFCGKKWNVLRKRVDSASYDIDQLFIGTLLFAILLFTLPTTALFYMVFSLLRLVVLAIQGILSSIVTLFNRMPAYWIILRFVYPKSVAGSLHFYVVQPNPLCIRFEPKPLSVLELFKMFTSDTASTRSPKNTWSFLGKKLLVGQLIYPWIEPSTKVPPS